MSLFVRRTVTIITIAIIFNSEVAADAPRFRFQTGSVITYQVENNTTVSETLDDKTTKTVSRLRLTKQWRCVDVDEEGVATIHLSLKALRNEQIRPNGESLLFDSEDPKKTTPSMRGMSKYVGNVLAVLRVGPRGNVIESKKTLTRFDSQLPFILQLPKEKFEKGSTWHRTFDIVLDPPLGTGEKYKAKQIYRCAGLANNEAKVSVTTKVLELPESALDQIPLLAKQPNGDVIFNMETGFVERVELTIDRVIIGHQGKESRYQFQSHYTEKRVGD